MNSRIFSSLLFQVFLIYNFEHFHHLTDGGLPGFPVDSGGRCSARKRYPVDITFSVISHTLYMQNLSNWKGSLHTFYTDKYLRIFCFTHRNLESLRLSSLCFAQILSGISFQDFELYSDNGFLCVHLDRRIRFLCF